MLINLKNEKYIVMVHNLLCIQSQIVTAKTISSIKKANEQLKMIETIVKNYGEESEFLYNFYQIDFYPFKKEMEKIMVL